MPPRQRIAFPQAYIDGDTLIGTGEQDNPLRVNPSTPSSLTLLASTVFTANGTWTPNANTKHVYAELCGGGGQGGGAAGAAAGAGAGGGGSGVYIAKWFLNAGPFTGGAVVIGAAGSGGLAGANDGGAGGNTTVVINGVTWEAKGGLGGKGRTNAANVAAMGGLFIAGSSVGDVFMQDPGGWGISLSVTLALGGNGGSGVLGVGGAGGGAGTSVNGAGTPTAGQGFGAGGGGAVATTVNNAGAVGSAGCVIITEYA